MSDQVAAAIAPLPAAYDGLFQSVRRIAESDHRIRALWLSGSLARGVADIGSDLDVIVTISDDARAEFAERWRDWLATITPTLIAKPLPFAPGSFYSTTVDGCRLDVVVESVSELPESPHRRRLRVFDRDCLSVPEPAAAAGPDHEKLLDLVVEFLRQQAIFPAAVVARRDWLLGVEGVHHARLMLYQLFVESNQPLPPMGVKQWSSKLGADQRRVLEALPAVSPQPQSVIDGMRATRAAFVTVGRETATRCGVDWPERLQRAIFTLAPL